MNKIGVQKEAAQKDDTPTGTPVCYEKLNKKGIQRVKCIAHHPVDECGGSGSHGYRGQKVRGASRVKMQFLWQGLAVVLRFATQL